MEDRAPRPSSHRAHAAAQAAALVVALGALTTLPAGEAAAAGRVSALVGGGAWLAPEQGGHGVLLFAYEGDGLPRQGRWLAEFNTDTLRLNAEGFRFLGGKLELGARGAVEAVFAGLAPDYYRDGLRDAKRGFAAHYAGLSAYAKTELPGYQYLELELAGRRWAFGRLDETAHQLVLPGDLWVLEPRVHYTLWRLRHDDSFADRQRSYPRVRGLALGATVGLDLRSQARPWGARTSDFDPPDPRNAPSERGLLARQWLHAGWQAHGRLRVQLAQHAAYSDGEDDLSRQRIGGLNPYVVPLPGAPWAALLAGNFGSAAASAHVRLLGDVEAGPLVAAVHLQDPHRTGAEAWGTQWGAGGFLDWRHGPWQADLRVGWSPTAADQHAFGMYLALGWATPAP